MIDDNRPFNEMTIKEISAELQERYAEANAAPLKWNDSSDVEGAFGVFGRALACIHDLLEILHRLRYRDGDAPWDKDDAPPA